MAVADPFEAPLNDPQSVALWRWGAAVWLVTWPPRVLWANLFVLVWSVVELGGRPGQLLWLVESICGVGLLGGAWVVSGSLVPRYVPALVFGATLRIGLLMTGRLVPQLPLLDVWIDLAACVALRAALARLDRRRARSAWLVTGVVALHLAVMLGEPWLGNEQAWTLADSGLSLLTWAGMSWLLIAVIVTPRPTS